MITIVLEYPDNWISLHQCLLMLFDSPLNHAGCLRVYIRMDKGVPKKMVEMHREIRIPRTFKRFQQLLANFLSGDQMPLVQTKEGQARLMTIVNKTFDEKKNQRQVNKIRIINLAPKVKTPKWFTGLIEVEENVEDDGMKDNGDSLDKDTNVIVNKPKQQKQHQEVIIFIDLNSTLDFNILGEGRETEYEIKTIELTKEHLLDNCDCYSLTRYPISPALVCSKLTGAFEQALNIL